MRCPTCRHKNEEESQFCTWCGAALALTSPYAGAGKRISAFLVDCILVIPLTVVFIRRVFRPIVFWWLSTRLLPLDIRHIWLEFTAFQRLQLGLLCLAGLCFVPWIYEWFWEASGVQATLGKIVFKIKVTDIGGHRVSVIRAGVRAALKALCLLTPIPLLALVNLFAMLTTRRRQPLYDLWSGCLVSPNFPKKLVDQRPPEPGL
jgi:uncharacterized RDD family membrane protein YckC